MTLTTPNDTRIEMRIEDLIRELKGVLEIAESTSDKEALVRGTIVLLTFHGLKDNVLRLSDELKLASDCLAINRDSKSEMAS